MIASHVLLTLSQSIEKPKQQILDIQNWIHMTEAQSTKS